MTRATRGTHTRVSTWVGKRRRLRHAGSGLDFRDLADIPKVHTESHITASARQDTPSTRRTGSSVTDSTLIFARSYGVRYGVALTNGFTLGLSVAMNDRPLVRRRCGGLTAELAPAPVPAPPGESEQAGVGFSCRGGGWMSACTARLSPA